MQTASKQALTWQFAIGKDDTVNKLPGSIVDRLLAYLQQLYSRGNVMRRSIVSTTKNLDCLIALESRATTALADMANFWVMFQSATAVLYFLWKNISFCRKERTNLSLRVDPLITIIYMCSFQIYICDPLSIQSLSHRPAANPNYMGVGRELIWSTPIEFGLRPTMVKLKIKTIAVSSS